MLLNVNVILFFNEILLVFRVLMYSIETSQLHDSLDLLYESDRDWKKQEEASRRLTLS